MADKRELSVAIIGAGAGGIMSAIKLRDSGIKKVVLFEKAADLGGTWRDNTYPGLVCDVPSHLYRFSFAPNPDWSQTFSPGSEIYAYVRKVAEDNNAEEMIRYNSEVTKLEYNDKRWRVTTTQGDQGEFDVVVSAVGILHHPVYPDIPGLDSFKGDCFHSARWDHDVSLKGKRVGIIGTGSTAVQIVGAIVDDVAHLSMFQRTPQWVMNAPNLPVAEEDKAHYRAHPEEMSAMYDQLAATMNHGFAAAIVGDNAMALEKIQEGCQQSLDQGVQDPELRAKLQPDYSAGCKRLIMSDRFYPAIQKPNAELVTDAIESIEPEGVRTRDGRLHALDVLVLCTGFDPHRFLADAEVVGRNGQTLNEAWSQGNYAYKTICVPNFPNLFFLGGPNSPIGNFSYLMTAERQFGYVEKLIGLLREGKLEEVTPKADVTAAFNQSIKDAMPQTVWASGGCQSWYYDRFGNVASWPWTFAKFEEDLSAPALQDFEAA